MSTLTVTTINTADTTTNQTLTTGNTTGAKIVVRSDASGVVIQGNSTSSTLTVNSTSISTGANIPLIINGDAGSSGYVLYSNGTNKSPYWSQPTASGTGNVTIKRRAGDYSLLTSDIGNVVEITAAGTVTLNTVGFSGGATTTIVATNSTGSVYIVSSGTLKTFNNWNRVGGQYCGVTCYFDGTSTWTCIGNFGP